MITVTVYKNQAGAYRGFMCMGHAEYAKKGQPDVLCAAVSTLTIAVNNSLEALAGEKIHSTVNEETGFLKCDFESVLQEKAIFLMDFLVFSLEQLSREYGGRYLQVKFEEV